MDVVRHRVDDKIHCFNTIIIVNYLSDYYFIIM